MKLNVGNIGTVGLFITMMASPCCFPLFGVVFTALGIGSFELFGEWSMQVFLALSLLSVAGLVFSFRVHRFPYSLLIAAISASLIFYSYFFIDADYWMNYVYTGMAGLAAASLIDYYRLRRYRRENKVVLESVITCPGCRHNRKEVMPTNACRFFYQCENCKAVLRPKQGDCCVFCSYGTVKCPPVQQNQNCCA